MYLNQKLFDLVNNELSENKFLWPTDNFNPASFSCNRSPSPEPIYNTEGKRLNTREFRVRKNLEEERHSLIQEATDKNADYKPPIDYK